MFECVRVSTGSRLHLGMFSFGRGDVRSFGGVGLMVDRPGFDVRVARAPKWESQGPLSERALQVARRCVEHEPSLPQPCRIEVASAPPPHAGLGTGTQLGMAVAAALHALATGEAVVADPLTLAGWAQRGKRSSVGLYGFAYGGLIVEQGRLPGEEVSPLVVRLDVPDSWRFLLIEPPSSPGLSGLAEQSAFDRLPPVPPKLTRRLQDLAHRDLIPAARSADFDRFSAAVFDYGRLAGSCYRGVQPGDYCSPQAARLVDAIRRAGNDGVFQSSWGPTIVAVLPDADRADRLQRRLTQELPDVRPTLTRPLNQAAGLRAS